MLNRSEWLSEIKNLNIGINKKASAYFYALAFLFGLDECCVWLFYLPYFLRNLSTRPAVSTTRCLPV